MLLNKIVVAEDDDAIAHMVNMALGDAGYLCLRAHDGEEAMRLVRTHLPDLLVLDVMMPRVDGLEVARRVKADVVLSKTPILMLTALADVEQKVEGLKAGADDYLAKPFDLREFAARVKALLRAARRERGRNPTTLLPGSSAVEEHVEGLLAGDKSAGVIHFHVVGFDQYAEEHGFAEADRLVANVGELLLERARAHGDSCFLGHVGGVDFVMVAAENAASALARDALNAFAERRDRLTTDGAGEISMIAAIVPTRGAGDSAALASRMTAALADAKKSGDGCAIWSGDAS